MSKRILVVEDETMIAFHIEESLAQLGHSIRTAATTAEAEAILASTSIDVAVLDYHLADGTSGHLAARLRELAIPFVVCSGTAGLSELGEVFQHTTFLSKPFTTEGLIDAVRAAVPADA